MRRIKSLRDEENRPVPQIEAQGRVLVEHNARMRNSERLADELAVELRREQERKELEELLRSRVCERCGKLPSKTSESSFQTSDAP